MVLVTGGSSSGKSAWAEKRLMAFGDKKRIYLATMIPWDRECVERITKHRAMRAEKKFATLECPVDVAEAGIAPGSAVLLECLSNLTANELYREDAKEQTDSPEERIFEAVLKLREKAGDLVIVSAEVFSDGEEYGEETLRYRKILGNLNRRIAAAADEVTEVVCGIPHNLKECPAGIPVGEPVRGEMAEEGNREEEKIHMKLIVGGASQGKLDSAFRLLEAEDGRNGAPDGENPRIKPREDLVVDGSFDSAETAFQRKILYRFHDYIRRFILKEPEPEKKLDEFLKRLFLENPDLIVVSDELGCGIVPVEKEERLWRELCGNACQRIAGQAGEVYRVICGIPARLKGGQ